MQNENTQTTIIFDGDLEVSCTSTWFSKHKNKDRNDNSISFQET